MPVRRESGGRRGPGRPPRPSQSASDPRSQSSRIDSHLSPAARRSSHSRQYHPEDFHVAVTDDAHPVPVKIGGVRFHPIMANEMHMLIARGSFPFDTDHDFIRVACLELLIKMYELERESRGIPNYLPRLRAINRMSYQAKGHADFDDSLRTLDEAVGRLLAKGQERAAASLVNDVLHEAKQIPEEMWREPYVAIIEAKYGAMLKRNMKRGLKMRNASRDDDERDG